MFGPRPRQRMEGPIPADFGIGPGFPGHLTRLRTRRRGVGVFPRIANVIAAPAKRRGQRRDVKLLDLRRIGHRQSFPHVNSISTDIAFFFVGRSLNSMSIFRDEPRSWGTGSPGEHHG